MKMLEALKIINDSKVYGYMVNFERVEVRLLYRDYFPDIHAGEKLIETEEKAWELANAFAKSTKCKCFNIYVTDKNFNPVPGYENKKIENR